MSLNKSINRIAKKRSEALVIFNKAVACLGELAKEFIPASDQRFEKAKEERDKALEAYNKLDQAWHEAKAREGLQKAVIVHNPT